MYAGKKGWPDDKKYFRWNIWVMTRRDLEEPGVSYIGEASKWERRLVCEDFAVDRLNKKSWAVSACCYYDFLFLL